jgi:TorA maturation chaperone TorD
VTLKEPPDHVAVELEFISLLITMEVECSRKKKHQASDNYRRKQQVFLKIHLGAWTPQFTQKIVEHEQTDFYRQIALATRSTIERGLEFYPGLHGLA